MLPSLQALPASFCRGSLTLCPSAVMLESTADAVVCKLSDDVLLSLCGGGLPSHVLLQQMCALIADRTVFMVLSRSVQYKQRTQAC